MAETLAEKDKAKLRPAVSGAVRALTSLRAQGPVRAYEVRAMIFDISTESRTPLPLAVQVLIPPDAQHVMEEQQLDRVSAGLINVRLTLG